MKRLLLLFVMALTLGGAKAADTTYNGETVSVTWSMSEGEENSKAVLSDRKTVMDFSWACGPGLGIAATPTRTIEDKTFTVFYPKITSGNTTGNFGDDYYIEWTLTPYDALSFTPTKVKLDAVKIGTDGPKMNIYIVDGAGNANEVATSVDMARIDGSHAFNAETNNWAKEFSISGCTASPNAVKLRVYVAKCAYNKTFSFANVTIEGTVTGVSHFREEYAVNIAPNNSEWGTVKSTKDYVVEENPVTLTATPNRGYRFLGWADAANNYVSTEASYTFVPEADINLTAVFEPLAVYQVKVASNIEGAGIVSVTTFVDGIYYEGDIIDISALPNQGYVFTGWSDGKTTWKRETITLAADVNLTALFEAVGESPVYAYWSMEENTNAEITGRATSAFSIDGSLTDSNITVTIDGATMRTFTATDDGTGSVTFNLGVTPGKWQVFVVRSIEFDAARVGTSYGTFSLSVDGNSVASDLYPGAFVAGVDYPHAHYYYYLGQSLEFQTNVPITLIMNNVSKEEGKGIAIGNVKVQGYYKTLYEPLAEAITTLENTINEAQEVNLAKDATIKELVNEAAILLASAKEEYANRSLLYEGMLARLQDIDDMVKRLEAAVSSLYFYVDPLTYHITSATELTVEVVKCRRDFAGEIEIPETVTNNGITYTVTGIASTAFQHCTYVTHVSIPQSVDYMEAGCFDGCTSLGGISYYGGATGYGTDWIIDDGVTAITAEYLTEKTIVWNDLTAVTLPATLKSIGEKCFYGCFRLMTVTSKITDLFSISDDTFADVTYLFGTLIVPDGMKALYESTPGWKNFRNIIEASTVGVDSQLTEGLSVCDAYTLGGQKVTTTAKKGLYIVRSAEGRLQGKNVKKVVKKQ